MERNFQVVDLIDSSTGRYLGKAIYCQERGECPLWTFDYSRTATGEVLDAFVAGAREVGGNVNLYHFNMPIEINTNAPYNEIRNTIIGKMSMKTNRIEQSGLLEET